MITLNAKFFQDSTMVLVLLSFVAANADLGKAYDLWINGAESIFILIALGIGMQKAKDVLMARIGVTGSTVKETTTETTREIVSESGTDTRDAREGMNEPKIS